MNQTLTALRATVPQEVRDLSDEALEAFAEWNRKLAWDPAVSQLRAAAYVAGLEAATTERLYRKALAEEVGA